MEPAPVTGSTSFRRVAGTDDCRPYHESRSSPRTQGRFAASKIGVLWNPARPNVRTNPDTIEADIDLFDEELLAKAGLTNLRGEKPALFRSTSASRWAKSESSTRPVPKLSRDGLKETDGTFRPAGGNVGNEFSAAIRVPSR